MTGINRRTFLQSATAIAAGSMLPISGRSRSCAADRAKLPVAAVVTVYRNGSHADVIVGKVLEGWRQDGGPGPALTLASIYVDQVGANDMSRPLAKKHGFRISQSIDDAITLGTDQVKVAGIISVGEHGDYPFTPDTRQHMYPRRRFFEEIAATFERCQQVVPVFNDKHLAYRWEDAKFMYDTAQKQKIPFLAGSSVPVAWRYPSLELDRSVELEDVVTIGWSGMEVYGFHTLEGHLAMIERRKGGESGVVSVQALQGDAVHRAAEEKRWSLPLAEAALDALPKKPKLRPDWTDQKEAGVILCEHRDGLKSAVVMTGAISQNFAFAVKIKGQDQPVTTWFRLQEGPPYCHFAHLVQAIEETIHTGRPVYPVERTLLTTGILDRVMHSIAQNGKSFETPELAIAYQPSDWPFANHPRTRLSLPIFE